MKTENEILPARNRKLGILSASGILLLVLGGGFLFSLSYNLDKKIEEKSDRLNNLEASISAKNDSITLYDSLLAEKRAALNEIVTAVSNNEESKVDSIIFNTTINENVLKSDLHQKEELKKSVITDKQDAPKVEQLQAAALPVVYIQAGDKITLRKLQELGMVKKLKKQGYDAFGYEVVATEWNPNTIRYFHAGDKEIAENLALVIEKVFDIKLKPLLITGYGKKVRTAQMEVWVKFEGKPDSRQQQIQIEPLPQPQIQQQRGGL